MISPAEAEAAVRDRAPVLPVETRPLDLLMGAVLREPIRATRDQPPFNRVTMDGIAFAYSEFEKGRRRFRISGTQPAGAPPAVLQDPEACLEAMTGAIVPHGCDCVVPVEKISIKDGFAELADDAAPAKGGNIHARGLDCRTGDALLEPGARLGAAEIAVIASTGIAQVSVSREPRIAVVSTGDELVEPGTSADAWQIYRSNAYAVVAALRRRGFRTVTHHHMPDDLQKLRTGLRALLDANDVLILSGGVSMGRFDYVPQVLGELGIEVIFHKVSQRPGKPMWFGVGASGQAVYALPGNPVSTLVCLARYVYPGLAAAQGATSESAPLVKLADDFEVKPSLTFFLPVSLAVTDGTLIAHPRPTRGSGDFISLLGTDGFVELPPGPKVIERGTLVPFHAW